jgi:hypothetical protein
MPVSLWAKKEDFVKRLLIMRCSTGEKLTIFAPGKQLKSDTNENFIKNRHPRSRFRGPFLLRAGQDN